jgi:SAM-dependent methyltransferase
MIDESKFPKALCPALVRPFLDDLDDEIGVSDAMFTGNYNHYFSVGASAMNNIIVALTSVEKTPGRILDFGCGAGRVTRWLRSAFSYAAVEGCDMREADLQFVAKTLGVQTWISGKDVDQLEPPSTYDLIWVGSVFTHLPMSVSIRLFDKLTSWLNPDGILILTSHGRNVLLRGESSGFYGIPKHWNKVIGDYRKVKYGYAGYDGMPDYGISVVQLSWWIELILSRSNLRLILMTEQAWDHHHDVIGVQLRSR